MGAAAFKSYGAMGMISCLSGALAMLLLYMGMVRDYPFFGYGGDMVGDFPDKRGQGEGIGSRSRRLLTVCFDSFLR